MNRDVDFAITELRRHSRRSPFVRGVLLVASVAQLVIAIPWLFGTSPVWAVSEATASHLTRDGVIGVVFGIIGASVAHRPSRAFLALPLAILMLAVQIAFVVVDGRGASVTRAFESVHILGVVIGVLVAALLRPRRATRRDAGLTLVDGESR
jgi:membrane associated rhomboid family serine protease